MQYTSVLFDLDGTLTRSEEGITKSALWAGEQLGVTGFSKEELKAFIGPPLYVSFPSVMGIEKEKIQEAVRLYQQRYERIGWLEAEVYPGIPRLLRSLRKYGIKTAMATAKPKKYAERIAEHFGLLQYLDAIVGPEGERISVSKRDLVKQAAESVGGNPVMIGDRMYDIEAAAELGLDSIGVTYGYGSEEELCRAGATYLANDVRGVQRLLLDDAESAAGIFITMEGMDGSGKTTQRVNLTQYLSRLGWEICETREPGGDAIAEKIREIILDPNNKDMTAETEAYLYAASRAQNVRNVIEPALRDGRAVVCDRFADSSVAYQGGGRMLGAKEIVRLNELAVDGLKPDITIYLDLAAARAIGRRRSTGESDRLEREDDGFYQRVSEAYDALCGNEPRVVRIDASGDIEEVKRRMLGGLKERLFQL